MDATDGYDWKTGSTKSERDQAGRVNAARDRIQHSNQEQAAEVFASKVLSLIQPTPDQPSNSATWAGFMRAAEHVITDINPTAGATPHGVAIIGKGAVTPLARLWQADALRANEFATLIEWTDQTGLPGIPLMNTVPTAGGTGVLNGEKTELYSKAFDITADAGTIINADLYLNISNVIEDAGGMGIVNALMAAAVANEADRQIVAAMVAKATDGGATLATAFAKFDGTRFTPSVVVIPPSQIMNVEADSLNAMGIRVVVDANATTILVADPNATVGWFKRGTMRATEPSVDGTQVAHVVYGKVGVQTGGVVTAAAAT